MTIPTRYSRNFTHLIRLLPVDGEPIEIKKSRTLSAAEQAARRYIRENPDKVPTGVAVEVCHINGTKPISRFEKDSDGNSTKVWCTGESK